VWPSRLFLELAEVGRRLEAARQQEAKVREDLGALEKEMTAKTAELAQAEQRLQQARELEARLQSVRQEMADTEAKLAEARRQLAIPPASKPTESAQPPQ
jgi:septal ring factor EnvC (AmiA/AmiB activator)